LQEAVRCAKDVDLVKLTRPARVLWESSYNRLTAGAPGSLGSVTNRAAPHVLRLALLYALMDRHGVIEEEHLSAALALWDASFRCAVHIFGNGLDDPRAERILTALQGKPEGLDRTQIYRDVFRNNVKSKDIKASLAYLLRHKVISETKNDQKRPVYKAVSAGLDTSSTCNT
jgi:hypothetical protein